jgi:pimeloyl-ACP methyl ester carboxylesterase
LLSVDVDGTRLSYVDVGEGESIVFVHGIVEDYRAWIAQIAPFSKGHRVIAYSRRMSQPNKNKGAYAESTIENNVRDLLGLVKKLDASQVTLIGHSYGSHIATYFAMQNPELTRLLVLVEPGLPTLSLKDPKSLTSILSLVVRHPMTALSADRFILATLVPALEAYHAGDLDGALNLFLDGIQGRKGALEQLPEFARMMMKENEATIGEVEARNTILTGEDPRSISAPVLLVKGTTNPEFMRDTVDLMSHIIPHSQVLAIPNSGHFPHFENTQFFNQRVIEFLAQS